MQNLRITNVKINSNSDIDVTFTEKLTSNIITSNVFIIADTPNTISSEVLMIKIIGSTINITCQPLVPMASYFIEFVSTPLHPFISINGNTKILEDGISNRYLITGPLSPDNVVKNYFLSYFKDNIYDISNDIAIVTKYIDSLSTIFSKALYSIGQLKNENYLSFVINDENKIRGKGPFDRLNEESAYDIIRVGRTPSGTNAKLIFPIDNFPNYPITLQKKSNVESLSSNSVNEIGYFNINNLILNLSNFPVTKITSISFLLNTNNPIYIYDISKLGYQIKNSRYNQESSFTYLLLADNQIKLNDKILEDSNFSLHNIIRVDIQYESKDLGRVIDNDTVKVTTIKTSIRETLPPIINIFNLKHAPIVNSNSEIPLIGGIVFTDPNSIISGEKHPAFTTELPFRLNGLPFSSGQYSVDYATGTVYVYGADINNDGTGPYPPLATYDYLFTFKSEQDYIYDTDLLDLVALPHGSLRESFGNIEFNYEEVLIPGIDYEANLHQEKLSERVDNRLAAVNVIKTQHSPVTNVFKIYNETSGEIYTIDRWNDNNIYFRYNNPPLLKQFVRERASFYTINNELLFIDSFILNSNLLTVIKIFINNNSIISETEDGIASSFNTSLSFSRSNDLFIEERWFNRREAELLNIDRLYNVGDYMIDYTNGIIYCLINNLQNNDIGTVSYKKKSVVPQFTHLISVDDIYYQISSLEPKGKKFSYSSFEEGIINPDKLDNTDELSINDNQDAIYQISNDQIGTFISSMFVAGVTDQIKFVRSIFEYDDLSNSINPLNFATTITNNTVNGFNIKVGNISGQVFDSVQFDGSNYYVIINQNIPYLSPNISYLFTITRISDSADLWNNSNTIIPGNQIKLILPGNNSPTEGDLVNITYAFYINDLSRVVIDYNKGDYYIDYTSVTDEIIISYEYGDNVIDFRRNKNLPPDTNYFVTYKAGALRDALLKNFGNLVNITELTNFSIDFDRERYRDALSAALTSFIQGPTITAMKNIGKTISHIEPEIKESIFNNWSLGNSLLAPQNIQTTGSFQLLPAKFDNGVLINSSDQSIKFPVGSNFRFEEGTFETWINTLWNGIDNDAILTFHILQDGYTIDPSIIFIGAEEFHPEIKNGTFTVSKFNNHIGQPNKNKDGIFIYYDKDISGNFYRWYIDVIDGYVTPGIFSYKFKIVSNGYFYDTKNININSNITSIFSGTNSINFNILSNVPFVETITFISDIDHYILDFAEEKNKNRLSIFKDTSGYLNFKIYDKDRVAYSISSDVSFWKHGDLHHIAASWKLNTRNNMDEMHLFIDGLEVPNIIKYGQRLKPYLHEKFRTVNPEEIVGLSNRDIIYSTDLQTSLGNSLVTSSINFSSYNIFAGDIIYIDEIGFDLFGYTIININGQNLTLSASMPNTLSNGRFSINRTQFTITSDIDISTNIIVSTAHTLISGSDINGFINSNILTSTTIDFSTYDIQPGYLIRVDDLLLQKTYTILQVLGNSLIINDNLPVNISNTNFNVYSNVDNEIPGVRAITPAYGISKDSNFNNILTISDKILANDLIFVRTLGLNHRRIKRNYYVWSDNVENILMTNLPSPISLDEVKIVKILLPLTAIGPSNSSLILDIFNSNNLSTYQPSFSQNGRTLSISIGGTNVDFTVPVQININGVSNNNTINETIIFNDYGTLDFVNMYSFINYINVVVKPININKNALTITIKEKYTITNIESGNVTPVIRFSYMVNYGESLYNSSDTTVTDDNNTFNNSNINDYLLINNPNIVAGIYKIIDVWQDKKTLSIIPVNVGSLPLSNFTGGSYKILNTTSYRGGLQNGFFTFEIKEVPNQPYFINQGLYELEYFTYTQIKIDPINNMYIYLGSDFNHSYQLNGIMDQVKIYSTMLTDTRIGENIPNNQRSITKDYNSLKPLKKDTNTLFLVNFNSFPFNNSSDFYINSIIDSTSKHFKSSAVVNENFGNSLVILNDPLIIFNDGILNTKKEGTIEFWISTLFDTGNDPNKRFYFDAFGAITEEVISENNVSLKLSSPANNILSVKLKGNPHIDYFVGGKLEIDTQNAILEEGVSLSNNSITVSKPILQVISVKIIGDFTETDYFVEGTISSDMKTIYLGKLLPSNNLPLSITYKSLENNDKNINTQIVRLNKKLPYQKSHVVVDYIPKGLHGDRISIFKDKTGNINFSIIASGKENLIQTPILWSKNTWHRVKASYKINGKISTDEMRLFLDGYQYDNVLVDGYSIDGYGTNIKFTDSINKLYIGAQYNYTDPIFSLMDNFRISNISRPIYSPYGDPIDINYTSNLEMAFPVTKDLFTTYLLNYDAISIINEDFAILKNRKTGLFDFSINIIDSLGIVDSSMKVREALEKLIRVLKPANSRVFIQYTK